MDKFRTPKLYCFSPPVMLATLVIEIILALHTIWRYKLTPVTRIVVALLVCLALFQWAEYNVCEGTVLFDSLGWAKLGYVAITMLPPLGFIWSIRSLLTNDVGFQHWDMSWRSYSSATFYWQ